MSDAQENVKPRINKCIFIGLGGTGTLSIKYAKAKVLKQYGEVPPMIRFLAFDTDAADANRPMDFDGIHVSLDTNEFAHLAVPDAKKVIDEHPDLTSFFPEKNLNSASAVVVGAGQIRSLGRLAMMANFNKVQALVSAAADQVKGLKANLNDRYVASDGGVNVYFCFSIAGGTGSGTFIDMAYVIKDALKLGPVDSSVAYVVLPEIFTAVGQPITVKNVEPNAYGALKEIEYLMGRHLEGVEIEYGGTNRARVDGDPFNVIITVNKTNSRGMEYNEVGQLTELIGSALWLNTGDIGAENASVWINIVPQIAAVGDVKGKRARYVGVGYSEVLYEGNVLRELYSHKAAMVLINRLLQNDESEISKLETRIDSWKIREDNNNDQVIDALLKNTPPAAPENVEKFEEGAASEIQTKSANYLKSVKDRGERESEANLKNLGGKKGEIEAYLNRLLNSDGGVGTTKSVLVQLLAKLNYYNQMMAEERDKFIQLNANLAGEYKVKLTGLGDAEKSFLLGRKKKIEEACEEYLGVVKKEAVNILEITRRQKAINFFSDLISYCDQRRKEVEGLYAVLHDDLLKEYTESVEKIAGRKEGFRPFVIHLHNKFVEHLSVDNFPPTSEFLTQLGGDSVSTWGSRPKDQYRRLIDKYTMDLPSAMEYANWTLDDALNELKSKYNYDLKDLIIELDKRSEPMWDCEAADLITVPFTKTCIIGMGNLDSPVISQDDFKNVLDPKATFVSTHDKNRIAIQKLQFPAPAFAIKRVKDYRTKYLDDQAAFDFHVDAGWERKMQEDGFDIVPVQSQGDAILVWSLGFVFGFIKRDGYDYALYSPQRGAVIDKRWYNLGKGKDREEAYNEFVKQKFVKETSDLLEKKFKEIGATEVGKILGEIKQNPDVYYDKFSCIGLERPTLDQRGYEGIKKLIEAEMTAVSECDERDLAHI